MKISLAIVGSRTLEDFDLMVKHINIFLEQIKSLSKEDITIENIISGGANGTDSLAERYAKENKINMIVYKPNWQKYGNAAGPMRNTDIVDRATHVIAFPSKKGKGTQDSIKKAKRRDKKLYIEWID